jgi:hypothetical protein
MKWSKLPKSTHRHAAMVVRKWIERDRVMRRRWAGDVRRGER